MAWSRLVESEDDAQPVVDLRGLQLNKSLQAREPEEIPSTAETKNEYYQTNPKAELFNHYVVKPWQIAIECMVNAVKCFTCARAVQIALLTYVFFSNVGKTMAYPGTFHKWPQIGETINDLYKGGVRNISSIVSYKEAKMARENLVEMGTNFRECILGGFFFLGHKDMYKEHLTENEEQRQPEQLCGVVEVRTIRGLEDQDCKDKLKFVCRFDGKLSRSGDLVYEGAVYQLFHDKLTWFQARDYCDKIDGILATPNHVNGIDSFVMHFVDHFQNQDLKRLWIGFRRLDYCSDSTPALGIPWMEGEPNYQYPCVELVRKVTGVVQAKTVNCSTESSSTNEPSLTSHTVEQTTDVPPTPSLGTAMISLIAVACVVVVLGIVIGVTYCIAKKFRPQ